MSATAAQRLASLIDSGERDLSSVDGHRAEAAALLPLVGEELGFRWRLLLLRAALVAPPADDTIAELYGELVEVARGDPTRLAQVRKFGERLRELQDAEVLPRTMMLRAPRRRRTQREH